MKAVVKSSFVMSSKVNGCSLSEFKPKIENNFQILVMITIGPNKQPGGHDYNLSICTPIFLDHYIQNSGPMWGRHTLIVNQFDDKKVMKAILTMIEKCERPTWEETAVVLARHFAWEFEDYKT